MISSRRDVLRDALMRGSRTRHALGQHGNQVRAELPEVTLG